MKRFIIFLTTIVIVLLAGCSYKDMNRLQFTTMSIIDIDKAEEIVFYSEHFVSDRGDTQEGGIVKRLVLMAKGRDVGEAFSNTQPISPYPIAYDVKKAIALTDNLARNHGIHEILDLIERDQDMTNKLFMFICEDDPVKILDTKMEDEMFTGIWLEDIMVFQGDESRILAVRANDYLNNRLRGSRVNLLPIIKIEKQPTEDRISISGAAIIVNDIMVDKITIDEVPVYKLLNNKLIKGRFPVPNPNDKDSIVTLTILKSKTKDSIDYNDEELTLNMEINMLCIYGSVHGKLDLLDEDVRNEMKMAAENVVKESCNDLFLKFQKKGIDLIDIETKLRRKYSNANMKVNYNDLIKDVKLNISVNIKIEGGQNITYSIN